MIRDLLWLLLDVLRSLLKSQRPKQQLDFAGRIVAAMRRYGYRVDEGSDVYNIVYVKNVDGDGNERPDRGRYYYDDQRCVIQVVNGTARMVASWDATVDPFVSVNDGGAAQIAVPSQQTAWQTGMHRGVEWALVQTGGPVSIVRDSNWNYQRDGGDKTMSGWYGINQHSGLSAGCLTVPNKSQQKLFMDIITQDRRYNSAQRTAPAAAGAYSARPTPFIFTTTILNAKDIK